MYCVGWMDGSRQYSLLRDRYGRSGTQIRMERFHEWKMEATNSSMMMMYILVAIAELSYFFK